MMIKKNLIWIIPLALAVLIGLLLIEGQNPPAGTEANVITPAGKSDSGETVWTCSMHPQIQLPQPGKCPICFMDLIPVVKTDQGDALSMREIRLNARDRKLAEVAVSPVTRKSALVETRLLGKVDYDETRLAYITAWVPGRIDKLFVDYTGSHVHQGQPMVQIYSPELLTAQAELIQAEKSLRSLEKTSLASVTESARRTKVAAADKLRLLGLTDGQVQDIIRERQPSDHVTLLAPISGIVIEKEVFEGQYVQTGTRIFSIADFSQVWVVLEAYESDLPWIRVNDEVRFQTEGLPGETFSGRVVYVDPMVNEKTRTVRVRLNVDNPRLKLKPGMFVRAVYETPASEVSSTEQDPLVIPVSAPLVTGKRAVVYVEDPDEEGLYQGREVVLGPKAGDFYIVKSGLKEGERVVTKGAFNLDSALQIMARPSMMSPDSPSEDQIAMAASEEPLPSLFASKIRFLPKEFQAIGRQVQSGDLEATKEAFKRFGDLIGGIDGSKLPGRAPLVWKEMAMLLKNDSVLGTESGTPGEALDIFREMRGHYRHLMRAFPIESAAESLARRPAVEVPPEFQVQVRGLVEAYEALHQGLAGDDLARSQTALAEVQKKFQAVNPQVLNDPKARELWEKARKSMADGIRAMEGSKDLAGLRTGFYPFSQVLIEVMEQSGVGPPGPLYEHFCPMAFGNTGAYWLARDETILNPYFGSKMLRCGEVKRMLQDSLP